LFGPRTVYITAEPDTFFSQPAACQVRIGGGKRRDVRGFVTHDENGWTFHENKKTEQQIEEA